MAIDPSELNPDALEVLSELAEKSSKSGKELSTALREAVDAYLEPVAELNSNDVEYTPDPCSASIQAWEEFFADPARPTADFMQERIDLPPQKRDLF